MSTVRRRRLASPSSGRLAPGPPGRPSYRPAMLAPAMLARAGARQAGARQAESGFGSFGRPSTRSPTMLRWISAVPPQIVSEREKKNDAWSSSTG